MKEGSALEPGHRRMLDRLQCNSFGYFIHEVNRANGLVLDKTAPDWPASIAAVGMGLSVYPVGVARGFIERAEACERTLALLRFLAASDQSGAADSSGYKGFYFHFLDMESGRRAGNCELSSIDTALLMAGVLLAGIYFDGGSDDEAEIRRLSESLYRRVDWAWMQAGKGTLCHGWKPESGFLPFHWEGYDEALILYLLALGSPTHPIGSAGYGAWCSSYQWRRIYGIEYLHAGPFFVHQMSHIWCDFRGLRDEFMRRHDCDYFENSRRASLVQQQYAIRNPLRFMHMGEHCWGITASDGPGAITLDIDGVERSFFDYVARGVPDGPDDGTLAPWAVAAALPFAPEIVAPTLAHLSTLNLHVPNPYGFKASFNPAARWVSSYHFGINEGPTVLMIENHRSGLLWSLMRRSRELRAGLQRAGFEGAWLDSA